MTTMADSLRDLLRDFAPKPDEPQLEPPALTLGEMAARSNARKTAIPTGPATPAAIPVDPFYAGLNLDDLSGSSASPATAAVEPARSFIVARVPIPLTVVDDGSSSGGDAEDTGAGVSFRGSETKRDKPLTPPTDATAPRQKRLWELLLLPAGIVALLAIVLFPVFNRVYRAAQAAQGASEAAPVCGGACIRDSDHPMANCKAAAAHYGKLVLPFTSWTEHNFTQAGQHRWLSARQVGQIYCMICDVESLLVTEADLAAKQIVNSTCYCAPSLVQVERVWRVESTNNPPHTLPIAQFAGTARAMCRLEAAETYESCLERADAVLYKERVHVNKIEPPM